jgi:uncharacterized protein (TIGR03435 family)
MLKLIPILLAAVPVLSAQTFESASVRPYVPQDEDVVNESGQIVYRNVTLKLALVSAYAVRPDQISGPAWLDSERYDIVAKPPSGATRDQIPAMLRSLLVDRFHMTVHVETRQRTSYALAPGGGFALTPVKVITGVGVTAGPNNVKITGASLPAFAGMLASFIGRPVADETGIQGSYDFILNLPMADLKSSPEAVSGAIRELGLKLETRNAPATYVVVENAERVPSEN